MISKAGSTVKGHIFASLKKTISIGIEKKFSSRKVKDAYVGLDVTGRINAKVEVNVVAGLRLV